MSVIAAAVLFTACNSASEEKASDQAEVPAAEAVAAPAPIAAGPMDPVCEMPKEASWTEYSVQGTDTTWFCSATCKEAFEKNPIKYTAPKS